MWKRDTSPRPAAPPAPPRVEPVPAPVLTAPAPAAAALKPIDGRAAENVVMTLGQSVTIKGELSASEDLTLYGQMDGRITVLDHTLTIGAGADIRAEVKASAVVIMGAISGNVTATTRVEIQATGSVTGDIVAPRIAIVEGGRLLGRVQMTGGQAQSARRTA